MADSDAAFLHETISEFLWAANYVVDHAWQGEYKITSKAELQRETYDDMRTETRLQANLVQNGRNKAADTVQSVVARWKQGDYAGKLNFSVPTFVYDKRCAIFNNDHATLSTVEGRITARCVLPDYERETPRSGYLFNDDYDVTGGELHYRDGEFYLHVRLCADVKFETADDGTAEHSTVLGVDLGIEDIAVTSTGTFWNGSELNYWHREFEKRRGSLQQRGTRAAHKTIQSVGYTETGRYDHLLHTVSKSLLAEALEHDCDVIAFENLIGIRERSRTLRSSTHGPSDACSSTSRYSRDLGRTSKSCVQESAVFQVRVHSRGQPPYLEQTGRVCVSQVRILTPRRLQRGEEYRPKVSTLGVNVVERRRTRNRALESRDVEHE